MWNDAVGVPPPYFRRPCSIGLTGSELAMVLALLRYPSEPWCAAGAELAGTCPCLERRVLPLLSRIKDGHPSSYGHGLSTTAV